MAEITSYQTKTLQNDNVKADTIKKNDLDNYQSQKIVKFKNVVSNQKDVTIDLRQFLDEYKFSDNITKSNDIETLYDDNSLN